MDVQLPGEDGLSLTRKLKAEAATARIPIVALTAHAMTGDKELAMNAGCAGYIAKPIDTRSFAGLVRTFLEEAVDDGGRLDVAVS
jgi:CheY-like chemotaxis protein